MSEPAVRRCQLIWVVVMIDGSDEMFSWGYATEPEALEQVTAIRAHQPKNRVHKSYVVL